MMDKTLLLATACAVTLTCAACNSAPNKALSQADVLISRGDVDGAHRLLRSVAQRLDGHGADVHDNALRAVQVEVLTRTAELNAGPLHNVAQALADNAKIVQLFSPVVTDEAIAAHCRMADLYRDLTDEPEHSVTALKAAAAALGSRTLGLHVREQLCQTLMAVGNFDGAYNEALEIIERWPNSKEASRARLTMGRADYMENRFARAARTLEALTDSSHDNELKALAHIEAGNCQQELGEPSLALEHYYAALAHHPNPSMVQDKIIRVRQRIYHIAPKDGILNASRPSRHIAAWQPRPTPQDLGVGTPIKDDAARR